MKNVDIKKSGLEDGVENSKDYVDRLTYQRGYRDGKSGLDMSSTSKQYHEGWNLGRRERIERTLRSY